MAGRRPQPPGTVSALSISATGDAPTDRVNAQVETAVQELQDQARVAADAVAAAQAAADAVPTGGRLLAVQVLTGSGTYTPTPGTLAVEIEGVACGGGGGGGQGVNGCGGGATSGAYFRKRVAPGAAITGGAYSAPTTGGAGGSNAGGNGATGSDATLVVQGVTYTLKGGPGGSGMPAPGGTTFAAPGGAAAGSSAGDVGPFQGIGEPGQFFTGSFGVTGDGGSCPLGTGGKLRSTADPGVGNPGQANGGGGGGGNNAAGGDGAPAKWIIKEYS